MDRNEVIRIARLASLNTVTESDINIVLMSYCLECGKPYYETALFVTHLLGNKLLLPIYFNYAMEYYERKFTVYKLWSKPDSNPLLNQGQRKLLLIF